MHPKARLSDPVEEAFLLHDRAVACRERSQLAEAESLGRKALAILEREAGPQPPDVANVFNHLGGVRTDGGDYAGAETLYLRSVAIMEKLDGQRTDDRDLDRLLVQWLNNCRNPSAFCNAGCQFVVRILE